MADIMQHLAVVWKKLRMKGDDPIDHIPSYAWPGGYPLYYLCEDSGVLCSECVKSEIELIAEAIENPGTDKQWELCAYGINWDDDTMYCDHCSKQIESAYGDS